ncbi:DNA double-strand break repair rad50 ATPase, putative isoform 2 [Hibiscus syriacus]|uniref:DNA double-strand break repair rad50 ATPase, putative isoform 2 n=1 Tax=Hibiscus syriacus TaxID=106335 RepID=A0A6A3AEC8_HIBSY|nr:uncharacterized protein LOC120128198 [Hibiscus syriacus]KAE8702941.1 DNA double-strand break repair rad50 ATPase, putative isoform 2 [Hibiscus syriacus]
MEKFHKTDCIELLSEIKHQEKLLNLKRSWLMGLSTSKLKKKQFEEPKFFKFKTLPESFLREDDMFYETIKTHVENAFGVSNFKIGNHVIEDSAESFDAPKINEVLFSSLDALTNDGLQRIIMILSGGSGKFEKTRCKMKKVIRECLPRFLSSEDHDHKKKTDIMQLYKILNDPRYFRSSTMKSMTPTSKCLHAVAIHVLDGLEDLPLQTLVTMDRKLRCVKSIPELKTCECSQKRKGLIQKVNKTARKMLMDLDEVEKLQEPLAKALVVADLSLKLTTGCQNTSITGFHQFTPEIVSLQNDIVRAIWTLKTKARFAELKALKLLLDPNVEIETRSLRGAITNMLTEFLFECSDMDTVPKSLLEALSVINKDSRSFPQGRFVRDEIEEEVECILTVSAEMKQVFWDLLPDHELDEEFADAYGEELEESDDNSCIEDTGNYGNDGKMLNEDLESCMSYSVTSIDRDDVIQNVKMEPEIASGHEKSSKDINQLKNVVKSLASNNRNCISVERDEVEQNIGVDPENASTISSNYQLRNETLLTTKQALVEIDILQSKKHVTKQVWLPTI